MPVCKHRAIIQAKLMVEFDVQGKCDNKDEMYFLALKAFASKYPDIEQHSDDVDVFYMWPVGKKR